MPKTPLNPSPLEIHSQEFLEVALTANPETGPGPGNLQVERDVFQAEEDPRLWRVRLKVDLTPLNDDALPPYTGSLTAIGAYRVHEAFPDDPERLVRITGASMLYGAIREMVATITARGPNGLLTLPSVSFFETTKSDPKPKFKKRSQKTKKLSGPK